MLGRQANEVKEFVQEFEGIDYCWSDVLRKLCFPEGSKLHEEKSSLWCSDHLCVAFAYDHTDEYPGKPADHFQRVIVHDDLWAATYPDFAKSLAWYAADDSLFASFR